MTGDVHEVSAGISGREAGRGERDAGSRCRTRCDPGLGDPRGLRGLPPAPGGGAGLLIDTDGRLVPLDWSLGSHLDVPARAAMARILVGAITRDVDGIVDSLEGLAFRPPDAPALRSIVGRHLRSLAPLRPPGLALLMGLLDEAVASAGLRVGANLLAFRKALLTLDGVLADVLPGFKPDEALIASFLPRLAAEWPRRALLPP